ncbi:MAG: hypothetical protein H6626_07260 [Pseudobdellovibrionaceae bacterium]|nr:hypothetical protein [Bdellovibrionales bacterium]USN48879.1 MAG: hypothetical protein H6626_07260 [Pseudobdellovibrionaceae bacterium]
MKVIFIAMALVYSGLAMADVAVGDRVIYLSLNMAKDNSEQIISRTRWAKEILAVASDDNQALVQLENNHGEFSQAWVPLDQLGYIDDIEVFCKNLRPQGEAANLEELVIRAGRFKTCKVQSGDGSETSWYAGDVPFGLVKRFVITDDYYQIDELSRH